MRSTGPPLSGPRTKRRCDAYVLQRTTVQAQTSTVRMLSAKHLSTVGGTPAAGFSGISMVHAKTIQPGPYGKAPNSLGILNAQEIEPASWVLSALRAEAFKPTSQRSWLSLRRSVLASLPRCHPSTYCHDSRDLLRFASPRAGARPDSHAC